MHACTRARPKEPRLAARDWDVGVLAVVEREHGRAVQLGLVLDQRVIL